MIEPDTVAGIPLGANKSQAIAVLGNPTVTGQTTDLSGATYDFLRWERRHQDDEEFVPLARE